MGFGSLLMQKAGEVSADADRRPAARWVLKENALARVFCEAKGWRRDDGTEIITIGGEALDEVRYQERIAPRGE